MITDFNTLQEVLDIFKTLKGDATLLVSEKGYLEFSLHMQHNQEAGDPLNPSKHAITVEHDPWLDQEGQPKFYLKTQDDAN